MSSSVPISGHGNFPAPTPQNTPLQRGTTGIPSGLSRPTVPVISEDGEDGLDAPTDGADDSLAGLQQHMVGMVQSRLAGLVGKSSGYIEGLPVDVKLNVEALKGIQCQYYELQNKYRLECLALERKVYSLFFFFVRFFFSSLVFLAIQFAILLGLEFSTVYPLGGLIDSSEIIRDRKRWDAFEALSHHQSTSTSFLFLFFLIPSYSYKF